jgi:hypothetical protein
LGSPTGFSERGDGGELVGTFDSSGTNPDGIDGVGGRAGISDTGMGAGFGCSSDLEAGSLENSGRSWSAAGWAFLNARKHPHATAKTPKTRTHIHPPKNPLGRERLEATARAEGSGSGDRGGDDSSAGEAD